MAAGDTQITIAGILDLRSRFPIGVACAECRRRELPSEL
jgi:bacterioferritin-associated ferredoxin